MFGTHTFFDDIFNLPWVYGTEPHCKLRSICIHKDTYVVNRFRQRHQSNPIEKEIPSQKIPLRQLNIYMVDVEPLWKTAWQLFIKINIYLSHDSAILLLLIPLSLPKKKENICSQKGLHKNIHRILLFVNIHKL